MLSSLQKAELDKIKPRSYRLLVQKELKEKGIDYNIETIGSVYSGRRNNSEILKTIIKVFKKEEKKKLLDQEILDQSIRS